MLSEEEKVWELLCGGAVLLFGLYPLKDGRLCKIPAKRLSRNTDEHQLCALFVRYASAAKCGRGRGSKAHR